MKTLFVEKQSMELRYERACLLLYHEGKRVSSVPSDTPISTQHDFLLALIKHLKN